MRIEALTPDFQRRREYLRRRFCVGLLPVLAMLLLANCASVSTAPAVAVQVSRSIKAEFFTLQGRLSVRVGDRLETGKIHWLKTRDEERLQLFTPFGSQIAELVKSANGQVTLRRGQETVTAQSVGELTASLLGVPLDMDVIAAWTQGIGLIENESTEQKLGNDNVWQVTAERFQVRGEYRFASRLSAISGDRVVRLVIDEWRIE